MQQLNVFENVSASGSASALARVSQIQLTNIKYSVSDNKKHHGYNGSLRWLVGMKIYKRMWYVIWYEFMLLFQ